MLPGNVFVVGNYIDAFSFRKGLLYPSLLTLKRERKKKKRNVLTHFCVADTVTFTFYFQLLNSFTSLLNTRYIYS